MNQFGPYDRMLTSSLGFDLVMTPKEELMQAIETSSDDVISILLVTLRKLRSDLSTSSSFAVAENESDQASIPAEVEETSSAFELPEDLIGSIDSTEGPAHTSTKTAFGEVLRAKFAKQGIYLP
ncbi:MAG: hypothetical protein AAFN40_16245 [Cyanobacteria bacterium J06560_6]